MRVGLIEFIKEKKKVGLIEAEEWYLSAIACGIFKIYDMMHTRSINATDVYH